MSKLDLTLGCHISDRTLPLYNGDVQPNGVNLNFVGMEPEETFWRQFRYADFEVSEMSMSSYMISLDQGTADYIAIPVFPSRFFRHSLLFINTDSGITNPSDLKGKRVGIPEYQMTATVWQRGILQNEYGVHPSDVSWYKGGLEDDTREERIQIEFPDELDMNRVKEGSSLSNLLETGEIDALLTARAPSSFNTDSVERLFDDYRDVEENYFKDTNCFPIMHAVGIRRDVYDENEWVAQELYKAFERSKERAFELLYNSNVLGASLPWLHDEISRTKKVMGQDFWPYGVKANRDELEALTQFHYEQGLSSSKHDVDDLFAPSTYKDFSI